MKIKKIIKENYKKTKWSAGETTQVVIYPEDADFSKKDFIFRISSATVECEKSNFTLFENYIRYICPLEGNILLTHAGDSKKYKLKKYNFHKFDGAADTTSFGKCRDYNIMLRKNQAEAEVNFIKAEKDMRNFCIENGKNNVVVFFVSEGSCIIEIGDSKLILNKFESLKVEDFDVLKGKIYSESIAEVIFQKIKII